MIQNVIFEIVFLKILFHTYSFLYSLTRTSGHYQIFKQKVAKPTKTSEKNHSFYNAVSPKKPHLFYEVQLT